MEELEIKKLKKKNKLLVIVLIVFIICVLGIASYYYFMKENNKDYIPVDVSKLTENIDYKYLLNNKTKEVKDLTPMQMLLVTFYSYGREISYYEREFSPPSDYDTNNQLPTIDDNGIAYPDYSKDKQKLYCNDIEESFIDVGQVKNWAREMGLSVSEIDKMDTSLFSCYGGGGAINGSAYVFDLESITSRMKAIFGTDNNIFDKSFPDITGELNDNICGNIVFTYDKNINKLFLSISGGCIIDGFSSTSILKEYLEDDYYKMDVLEYIVDPEFYGDNYPKNVKIYNVIDYRKDYLDNENPTEVGTVTINSKEDEENIDTKVLKYKDKLNNYTLNFKKVGDNYQFVKVDYKG